MKILSPNSGVKVVCLAPAFADTDMLSTNSDSPHEQMMMTLMKSNIMP